MANLIQTHILSGVRLVLPEDDDNNCIDHIF
jgi:hypothetical protein